LALLLNLANNGNQFPLRQAASLMLSLIQQQHPSRQPANLQALRINFRTGRLHALMLSLTKQKYMLSLTKQKDRSRSPSEYYASLLSDRAMLLKLHMCRK